VVHDGTETHDADVDVVSGLPHVELGAVLGHTRGADGVGAP